MAVVVDTAYDASYLWLAVSRDIELVTLDNTLARAAGPGVRAILIHCGETICRSFHMPLRRAMRPFEAIREVGLRGGPHPSRHRSSPDE